MQSSNKRVTYRLTLKGKARKWKNELVPFFEEFVKDKIEEYKQKRKLVNDAMRKSETLFSLMENNLYDSLWSYSSDTLKSFTKKEQFKNLIEQRKNRFNPEGPRSVSSRRIEHELEDGTPGEYYAITFQYSSGEFEVVTFKKEGNDLGLLGYSFHSPKN